MLGKTKTLFFILLFILISNITYAVASPIDEAYEDIPFLVEGRTGSTEIYNGWREISGFVYRPSYTSFSTMIDHAIASRFGGKAQYVLDLATTRFQFVQFAQLYLGLIAEVRVILKEEESNCYIYSRFTVSIQRWALNHYECKEARIVFKGG